MFHINIPQNIKPNAANAFDTLVKFFLSSLTGSGASTFFGAKAGVAFSFLPSFLLSFFLPLLFFFLFPLLVPSRVCMFVYLSLCTCLCVLVYFLTYPENKIWIHFNSVFPAGKSGISARHNFNFLSLFWPLKDI